MHQETVLIIDDEAAIRDSLAASFSDEGYKVLKAKNGESGLDIFFRENVDVVITDLKMPEKDGIEVMNEISICSPETPMIVISGYGDKKDIISALRMGAKDFITKPIEDLDVIHHVIRKALENKYLVEQNRRYRLRLEKSEARYRTITEQIAEGVFTVDVDENLTFTNPAFCRMLGFLPGDLLNTNLKQLTTRESFNTILEKTLDRRNGKTGRYEIQMIDRKDRLVHVELACSPLLDDNNQYTGSIAVVRDITELIKLREKYQEFLKNQPGHSNDVQVLCANCKSIKDKNRGWIQMENFFDDMIFSHGVCPSCCEKLYPGFDFSGLDDD